MSLEFRMGDIGFVESSGAPYETAPDFQLSPKVRKTRPQHQRTQAKRMVVIRPKEHGQGREPAWVREALVSPIEVAFGQIVDAIELKFGPQSSLQRLIFSEEYMAIIGMGARVVPLLLADLKTGNTPWFWALKAITRENVGANVGPGDFGGLRDAWLAWGAKKGLI